MKRLLKLVISLAVCVADALVAGALRILGKKPRARCVVLYYHAIRANERGAFAAQMDCLVRCATPISADHQGPLSSGYYAAVTFDDGFISVIENALPELESRQIPATIFVPTRYLGGPPLWVKNEAAPARRERIVSAEDLKNLKDKPLLEIGSHSVTHTDLSFLDPVVARTELIDSKATLEKFLGRAVRLFSFPHGECNDRLFRQARDAGYQRVFTVSPRCAFAEPGEFAAGRVLADPTDWMLEFKLKLRGAYRWMSAVTSLKRLARRVTANDLGCVASSVPGSSTRSIA